MCIHQGITDDDMPRDRPHYKVTLRANNPMVISGSNPPAASSEAINWFEDRQLDILMSHWDTVVLDPPTVDHFVVIFYFLDPDQAMLFKLTWGGL